MGRLSPFTNWIIIIVIIIICDPYFSGTQRKGKYWHLFGLSDIGSQVSFLVQCLRLKLGARTSEGSLSAIFSFLLFESLRHSYFQHGTLVLQYCWSLTVSVEPRPYVQRNFLKETRFLGQPKTTLKNKAAEKAL